MDRTPQGCLALLLDKIHHVIPSKLIPDKMRTCIICRCILRSVLEHWVDDQGSKDQASESQVDDMARILLNTYL